MSVDLKELMAAYASMARPEILRDHAVASCVASTWITVEVMRRFGVPPWGMTVRVEILNYAAVAFECQNGRRPWVGESDTTWIVGIGFEREAGGIGTHVVAIVDSQVLVDASIDQGNNTEHAIALPGVVCIPLDETFLKGGSLTYEISGVRLIYTRNDESVDFASLHDWTHNPETDSAVERIVTRHTRSRVPAGSGRC